MENQLTEPTAHRLKRHLATHRHLSAEADRALMTSVDGQYMASDVCGLLLE